MAFGGKSYKIRLNITDEDLEVLKKALASYDGAKKWIAKDLLGLIKHQEGQQDGRESN